MKSFEEYNDGDWVVLNKPGHEWHLMQFQAYKSQFTHNAFRLKYGTREYIADINEILPLSEANRLMSGHFGVLPGDTIPCNKDASTDMSVDDFNRLYRNDGNYWLFR